MKRHILLVPMLGIGAFAILVLAFYAIQGRHQQSELQRVHAEIGSLSSSVERLQHTERNAAADRLFEQIAASSRPAPREEPAPQAGPADSTTPRGGARPRPLEVAEVRDLYESSFTHEKPDPQWVAEAQSTAEAKLTGAMPETSQVRSIACRSSMCRLETVHEDVEHYQQFVQSAFFNPETKLWNGGFFSTPLSAPGDGKLVIVSYLARDGEDLPPVSPDDHPTDRDRPE
jgi:hypothetical protein